MQVTFFTYTKLDSIIVSMAVNGIQLVNFILFTFFDIIIVLFLNFFTNSQALSCRPLGGFWTPVLKPLP